MSKRLTIIIPMAGLGSRFAVAGYREPKPLIPIRGVPMIRIVIENLRPSTPHRFVFVCQREHVETYKLRAALQEWAPGSALVQLDGVTEGAACTVLAAASEIDGSPLMIANSDQYVDASIDDYLSRCDDGGDGMIMTMTSVDPKWSFVGLDSRDLVNRVAEKDPISDEATVGIYNFTRGDDFVAAAGRMISLGKRVNNEFYVAPVYNEMLEDGATVRFHNIGTDLEGMYGLGTPADLDRFLSLPVSERASAIAP